MRIGIYNHQHLRGGCPICTQTYVQGMIADGMKCMNRAKGIYGEDNEFVNYTDLGDYPSENLERPGFRRLMKDLIFSNGQDNSTSFFMICGIRALLSSSSGVILGALL